MDFAKLAAERYSLRKFSDRPVEAEKLSAVLEAGRNAPTAHNLQPQRIFVLQSSEALEKVDGCTGAHFHPPVMLLVAYDPETAWKREDDGKNHGEIDAAIAVTQMMLQAADLGLGTTSVGMFDPEKLHAAFPEALSRFLPGQANLCGIKGDSGRVCQALRYTEALCRRQLFHRPNPAFQCLKGLLPLLLKPGPAQIKRGHHRIGRAGGAEQAHSFLYSLQITAVVDLKPGSAGQHRQRLMRRAGGHRGSQMDGVKVFR